MVSGKVAFIVLHQNVWRCQNFFFVNPPVASREISDFLWQLKTEKKRVGPDKILEKKSTMEIDAGAWSVYADYDIRSKVFDLAGDQTRG